MGLQYLDQQFGRPGLVYGDYHYVLNPGVEHFQSGAYGSALPRLIPQVDYYFSPGLAFHKRSYRFRPVTQHGDNLANTGINQGPHLVLNKRDSLPVQQGFGMTHASRLPRSEEDGANAGVCHRFNQRAKGIWPRAPSPPDFAGTSWAASWAVRCHQDATAPLPPLC